jgi:putative membrane protein
MRPTLVILPSYLIAFGLLLIGQNGWIERGTPIYDFLSVIAYSLIGMATLFTVYKLIDWILPADVEAEIFDKQNLAVAVFKGLLLLGISIIIAAVILSP